MFNIDNFLKSVDFFVTSHKNDLIIDKAEFKDNTPFIHIARPTGSRMITRSNFMDAARRIIENPYGYTRVIFANVQNSKLMQITYENEIHTLEFGTNERTPILIHYYNGKTVEQLSSITDLYAVVENWKHCAEYKIENALGFKL